MPNSRTNKLTRAEVYARIDSERAYQESRWTDPTEPQLSVHHSFEEWCVYIEDYLDEMKHWLARRPLAAPDEAGELMRKVAAMAVCCLEQHGCEPRGLPPTA